MPINNPSSTIEGLPLRLKADFHAAGDGITDDTVAIQAIVDQISIQGRRGEMEEGTFLITSPITMKNGTGGTSGVYGDGFVLRGAGPKLTVLKATTDIAGIIFPHAVQGMILENFGLLCTAGSSTHNAIHCDGSLNEAGNPGGASMNACRWSNIEITGFKIGIDATYFSNSQVINCDISCPTGVHVYGSSNSVVFSGTTTTGATVFGYHLEAGQAITVQGCDITTTGSAVGIEIDGASNVAIINVRCENGGSGYPAEVNNSSSDVIFIGCGFANFGGTSAYGLHVNAGTVVSFSTSFVGTAGGVRVDSGTFRSDHSVTLVDYFSAGSLSFTYPSQIISGDTALLENYSLILRGVSHGSGSSLYGGALIWDGKSNTRNYAIGFPFNNINGDLGIYVSAANGTIGLSGITAGTGQPNVGLLTFDGVNQRIHSGNNGISGGTGAPTGTATMNVYGSLSVTTNIFASGLPTSNPHVVGQLYTNAGIVTVSAG